MTDADSGVVSPPTNTTTSQPPPASGDEPISPVARSGSFPHKTSHAVATRTPFIDTSTPSINNAPVELDGIPTSPTEKAEKSRERSGSIISPGLGEEDEINEEFLGDGEKGAGREVREKRAAMLANRSKDPGVIVDVPKEPTAEEVEAAKTNEGATTPAIPQAAAEEKR